MIRPLRSSSRSPSPSKCLPACAPCAQAEDIGQCLLGCLLSDWGLLAELSALKNLFLLASPSAQAWADRTLSGMLFHGRPLEDRHEYELDVALQVGPCAYGCAASSMVGRRGAWRLSAHPIKPGRAARPCGHRGAEAAQHVGSGGRQCSPSPHHAWKGGGCWLCATAASMCWGLVRAHAPPPLVSMTPWLALLASLWLPLQEVIAEAGQDEALPAVDTISVMLDKERVVEMRSKAAATKAHELGGFPGRQGGPSSGHACLGGLPRCATLVLCACVCVRVGMCDGAVR